MDALTRRDARSVSERGREDGSRLLPPDHLGSIVRKMSKGDRIVLRLGERELGYVELKSRTSDGARILLRLDREVRIEGGAR